MKSPQFQYQKSNLWLRAFCERDNDRYASERDRLRVALDQLRERAGILSNEIAVELRELTVHDLSHSDALWDVAEVITGENEELNPLEAFVLGATFLIHDLGMGLAAYPDGLDSLRRHPLWIGMLRNFFKKQAGRSPDNQELENPPTEVLRRAQFELLRILHAERAEKLMETTWTSSSGAALHLLDDAELRQSLGFLIGRIAYSHWWPASELVKKLSLSQGAPVSFPGIWQVNSLRIALILRTSDAAHIDARRAPRFLRIIRKPEASSDLHWAFQEKLNRVQIQVDRLLYTGCPFFASEAGAWWLCADTLRMIDAELRTADNILADRRAPRFAAKGVVAVEDPRALAQCIPAEGWSPADARVHVSNIATLATRLGGRELYGDNDCAPLRELLQNAADAIEARRIIQKRAEWGSIILRTGKDTLGSWIEVEDDGVGMSPDTLIGTFLDFGRSFWSSTESIIEFPELAAADFRSIGTFGLGFFSVFMWGDRAKVTSRRFDASKRDTHVLTFAKGLAERPILREADPDEYLADGGTRVRVWLEGVSDAAGPWMRLPQSLGYYATADAMSPQSFIKWLCPMLGIRLFDEQNGPKTSLVPVTHWATLRTPSFLSWSTHPRFPRRTLKALAHIRPMRNAEGKVVGRAALSPETSLGWVMVGGMRAKPLNDFVGAFAGEPRDVSREESWVNVPESELKRWAEQQARLISANFSPSEQMECSRIIEQFGASTKNLHVCRIGRNFLKNADLVKWARSKDEVRIIDMYEFNTLEANLGITNLRDDVLFEPVSSIQSDLFYRVSPRNLARQLSREVVVGYEELGFDLVSPDRRFGRPVLKAIAEAWRCPIDDLFISQQVDEDVASDGVYLASGIELLLRRPPALTSSRKPAK